MSRERRRVTAERGHPVFAWLYAASSRSTESGPLGRRRADLVRTARGTTLDLGAGIGLNLPHLPAEVTTLHLVEPDPHMRDRLHRAAPPGAVVHAVGGEDMPLPDASVDTVLSTLTMCSVDDPAAVARELHRVLRPGGRVLVLEHVLATQAPWTAAWQRRLDPVYTKLTGGCHLDRDTGAVLAAAGFDTADLRSLEIRAPALTSRHVVGEVHRRSGNGTV